MGMQTFAPTADLKEFREALTHMAYVADTQRGPKGLQARNVKPR